MTDVTSSTGTEHGWAECPMHGEYRDDEYMCPDCFDNARVMGEGEWSVGTDTEHTPDTGDKSDGGSR